MVREDGCWSDMYGVCHAGTALSSRLTIDGRSCRSGNRWRDGFRCYAAGRNACLVTGSATLPFDHLPIIDLDRLKALSLAVGRDALVALAARFGTSVDSDLARIQEGAATGNRVLVAEAAHSLKGLAVTFGAGRLQAAAQALQAIANTSEDLAGPIADIEAAAVSTTDTVAPAVGSLYSA